jgi:hypothetical protein
MKLACKRNFSCADFFEERGRNPLWTTDGIGRSAS